MRVICLPACAYYLPPLKGSWGSNILSWSVSLSRFSCSVLSTLKSTTKNRTGGKIEEEKEKKENGKEGTQIYSGIQGTDGGAI